MTNYEKLTKMTIKQLANWLDKYGKFDCSPWMTWFDINYCQKCDPEIVTVPAFNNSEAECSYCELNHKCRLFPKIKEEPSNLDIIKMWLEQEVEKKKK